MRRDLARGEARVGAVACREHERDAAGRPFLDIEAGEGDRTLDIQLGRLTLYR